MSVDLFSFERFERFDRDDSNDVLWNRITDVNADRSNQLFDRAQSEAPKGCKIVSSQYIFDTCNLPNYQIENHLRQMFLINNRDNLDYVNYKAKCLIGNRSKTRQSVKLNADPIKIHQSTKEI